MKNFFTVLFLAFILVGGIKAQDSGYKPVSKNDTPEFLAKIEKASAAITSLQCSFIQKKNISVLSETVTSKGKLLFKKENKLCWEYQTPYYYLFALNGDKVYIKNDKTTKEFDTKSNALFKEISVLLVNSIKGAGLIDTKKFDAAFFQNAGTLQVKLTPKNKTIKSILSSISLYFGKTDYMVHSIEMMEASGDSTTIIFSEIKLNQNIPDEKFVVH
jgi:outer membrane lipoprotein-sorting protein